jgi:transcriptional regulator with XRE-family HTH domain
MKRPLANMLRKLIRAAKVSPATVAKTAGVSVPTLYSAMNGRTPTTHKITRIMGVLNVPDVEWEPVWKAQLEEDYRARFPSKIKVEKEKLPKDERALLSRYRALPKAHKRIVMGMMGLITGK